MIKPALIVTLASVFLAAVHGQKKSEAVSGGDTIFSSDSRLVLIDTIVTDKKGAYVGDLLEKNFKVREDGRVQTLSTFSYQADGGPGDDGQNRYLVLLFDNTTIAQIDQHYARDAAMGVIESNAGPNRLMATVEFGGALKVTQNLTNNADRLKQAVNGAKVSVTPTGVGGAILRSGDSTATTLHLGVRNLAKGMASVPGRKTIILFSEGLKAGVDQMKAVIEECNRANVAIYPVNVGALAGKGGGVSVPSAQLARPQPPIPPSGAAGAPAFTLGGRGGDSTEQSPEDSLYNLAQATGGFVISSPDQLQDEMNRIGKEQNQYYVLGYLPAKESRPGACHNIKVEVDRGGTAVRARNSYCDEKGLDIRTGTTAERDLEGRLNSDATRTVQATIQTPFFYVAPNTARVDLALDLPGAALKFTKDKGRFMAILNVIGIASFPDGGVAARFNDTRRVTLDDQKQVDDFATQPYHYEKQFEMASGTFNLKAAFSAGPGSFGAVETSLTIDPWEPSKFLLSGLALSQSTRPAPATPLGSEVDLFGDKVPLVVNGIQFIPGGSNHLRKAEKAWVYAEIYEPALMASGPKKDPGLGVQMSLMNATTGKLVRDMGINGVKPETAPGTSMVPLSMTIPIGDLEPGLYTAQITAQDAAGNRSVRKIDFELTP